MGARRRSVSEVVGDELFRNVERTQGYAFISDAIDVLPLNDMVTLAKQCRRNHNKSVTIINEWLRKWEPRVHSSSAPQPKPSGWDRSNCPQRANGVCELATCECEEAAHQQSMNSEKSDV